MEVLVTLKNDTVKRYKVELVETDSSVIRLHLDEPNINQVRLTVNKELRNIKSLEFV
jgi:hypothetical protein